MKLKFLKMYQEKRKKIKDDIDSLEEEIRLFKHSSDINNAFAYFSTAESIKSRLDIYEEKVHDVEYE